LRCFAPHGRHVAPMGVKFGTEEGIEGCLLRAKFYPHRCNNKGVGPHKLTFLPRFDQNVKYKRPAGAYPLRDFHNICTVCTQFQDALAVKIWLDLLERFWSCAPSGETMRQTPKVLQVQERARGSLSPCQVWWGSHFTRRRGGQKG